MENKAEEIAKIFFRNVTLGIVFFLGVVGFATALAFVFHMNLTGNLTDFGTAIKTMNAMGILWGVISFIEIGAMIIVTAWLAPMIGKLYKVHGSDEPKIDMPKRIKILGLFLYGIVGSLFIYGMVSFVQGISPNTTITNVNSLKVAIMTGNIVMFVGLIVVMAIFGTMWIWFGKNYHRFQNKLPEKSF